MSRVRTRPGSSNSEGVRVRGRLCATYVSNGEYRRSEDLFCPCSSKTPCTVGFLVRTGPPVAYRKRCVNTRSWRREEEVGKRDKGLCNFGHSSPRRRCLKGFWNLSWVNSGMRRSMPDQRWERHRGDVFVDLDGDMKRRMIEGLWERKKSIARLVHIF